MDLSRQGLSSGLNEGHRHSVRVGTIILALVAMTTGCLRTTVMATGAQPANSVERWEHFLIAGLIPLSEQWDARTDCQAGVAKVESSMQIGNVLLTALTAGIYTSVTLKVWCAAGAGATGAPSPRTVIVVPGSASLMRLRDEYQNFEQMIRVQAAREDIQIAKLDSAAGAF